MSTAADLALALNPALLAERAGYVLDDWQKEVLYAKPRRLLLNTGRQVGKTLCVALLATHQMVYEPGSLTVVGAVAQRQAAELVRTCRAIYGALGRPVPAESENKLSLELENGSRVLSIPATEATVRGLSGVRLLVLDEASRIPDAFFGAVLPFLATSGGSLALLSTPLGRRGFFWDAYRHRERDGWFYREVPSERCARIPPAFLSEMRRTTSEAFFAQEFECAFNDATSGSFRSADIEAAVKDYPTWGLIPIRYVGAVFSAKLRQAAWIQLHPVSRRRRSGSAARACSSRSTAVTLASNVS